MNEEKVTAFLTKLSKQTADDKIAWHRLSDYEGLDATKTPRSLTNILFMNEWKKIDYFNSYYAILKDNTLFLILEMMDSPRDGSFTRGYKMYLHNDETSTYTPLPVPNHLIYRLLNAVTAYVDDSESPAEAFIDDYLNSN